MSDAETTQARYVVGIDLGTTNCTLAFAEASELETGAPAVFDIPQVVHQGEVAAPPRLPSFIYLPAEGELPEGSLSLPWASDAKDVAGSYAQARGAEVPGRVISSAKSWLCHGGVDRRAPILPPDAPEDVAKLSPIDASARYLSHLKAAWGHRFPELPLDEQELVITVPASFDAVARELTQEAVQRAGLERNLTLLEEPQAALYAWVAAQGDGWRKSLEVGDVILVCDLGGGTTDFSLIAVRDDEGNLGLERIAVGDHILLGGDNMDLALAYRVKMKLEAEGKSIDDWQLRGLMHSCRAAKEMLLENPQAESYSVVVPGRGRKLIGGTLRAELTRGEVVETILDGFFPTVDANARPAVARRAGLSTLGLPYATDAGMTRHLAAFLGRHAPEGKSFLHPSALLFNGGVTKSPMVRERIVNVINHWLSADGGNLVKVLEGDDPDLAVSRGAAYYAKARKGRGVRIKGGTARAYYVGIERAELAVPGIPPRLDAVCIAPFGMEEGTEVELPQELALVVGEHASFRFFASSTRRDDEVAAMVAPDAEDMVELPAIETTLEAEPGKAGQMVPVKLHSRVTEVGTLELSAVELGGSKRYKLEFDVRVS